MAPKISVVCPVYNREGMVRHAIQSILDQTYDDWELVVVDDGSTDSTAHTVELFAKKDKRIRLVKNPVNKGISYSRNRGNKSAKGEIIVVQDSDDMSFPDRLEEIAKIFNSHPHTDVLYHWFYIRAVDIRYGMRGVHREIHRCGPYDRKKALTVPYIPGQLAYRQKVAQKCPYRKEMRFWDDWAFIIDATMNDFNFTELQRPLYEYVVSDDSVTTMSDQTNLREEESERLKKILKRDYNINAT